MCLVHYKYHKQLPEERAYVTHLLIDFRRAYDVKRGGDVWTFARALMDQSRRRRRSVLERLDLKISLIDGTELCGPLKTKDGPNVRRIKEFNILQGPNPSDQLRRGPLLFQEDFHPSIENTQSFRLSNYSWSSENGFAQQSPHCSIPLGNPLNHTSPITSVVRVNTAGDLPVEPRVPSDGGESESSWKYLRGCFSHSNLDEKRCFPFMGTAQQHRINQGCTCLSQSVGLKWTDNHVGAPLWRITVVTGKRHLKPFWSSAAINVIITGASPSDDQRRSQTALTELKCDKVLR